MLLNGREALIRLAVLLAAGAGIWTLRADAAPRMRVIIDNDFGSDPDGLVQLAHHLLSPSVDIPLIISSHLHAGENWDDFSIKSDVAAARGAEKANQLIELLGMSDRYRARPGVERAIADRQERQQSPVMDAIVTEALRQDVSSPLYYACGAGLTELALAWLTNPDIGKRLVLIWIGGPEHAGLAYPLPGPKTPEYNLTIDRLAAQVVFNESDISIWQIPRNIYRHTLYSNAELRQLARESTRLGAFLKQALDGVASAVAKMGGNIGETYVLGDTPLVTMTALQSSFEPDPSSSLYIVRPTPLIDDEGGYAANENGRPMRVYTSVDNRMSFQDMKLKFVEHDKAIP